MSKFNGMYQKISCSLLKANFNHQNNFVRLSLSSMNLHTLKNSGKINSKNVHEISRINKRNLLQSCAYSSYLTEDDKDSKKYKEVIKSYSLQVPSFGGKVSASSPIDITVS